MSRNGSGTYSLPAGNPVVTGTTISSTWANTTLNDIANALTGSVAADGQTPVTGNINMTNNKIVNVLNPTNPQDAATKDYVDTEITGLGTMATQNANAVAITGGTVSGVSATNLTNAYVGQTTSPYGAVLAAKASGGNIISSELTTSGPGTAFVSVCNASAANYDHFGAYHIGSATRLFGVGSDGAVAALSFTQSSGFTNAASGYLRLPSGAIMQWGSATVNNVQTNFAQYWWEDSVGVTFPIAFPTACWNVQVTGRDLSNSSGEGGCAASVSTTGFTVVAWNGGGNAQGQNVTVNWVAIGN